MSSGDEDGGKYVEPSCRNCEALAKQVDGLKADLAAANGFLQEDVLRETKLRDEIAATRRASALLQEELAYEKRKAAGALEIVARLRDENEHLGASLKLATADRK